MTRPSFRYSVFALVREAFREHRGWPRAWASPEPRGHYQVIIVGAGGHGLATAYYLGRNFGIRDVAVLDKGWLGGGNTGRNTTIIRSNYLQDPSAAIYEKARALYETLSQELNYNIMFSPRGVLMLAQTEHELKGYQRTARANALQGVDTRMISPAEVKKLVPIIRLDGPRYPVLGGLWQPRGGVARHDAVAWGYARACSDMGMHIIENCAVTGIDTTGGRVFVRDLVRVRVVPGAEFGARQEEELKHRVRLRLGESVRVEVERVKEIERTANGKFRAVVSKIGAGLQ